MMGNLALPAGIPLAMGILSLGWFRFALRRRDLPALNASQHPGVRP
ncbi:MAG TPA: hypothetical protein VJN18_17995 [Polyangiaceae bacterium]|nr:hypothetical protein [Polyangiaceae bacterium]